MGSNPIVFRMLEIFFPYNTLQSLTILRLLMLFSGINKYTSQNICYKLGINSKSKYIELPEYKKEKLNSYMSEIFTPYQEKDKVDLLPLHSGYYQDNLKQYNKQNIE